MEGAWGVDDEFPRSNIVYGSRAKQRMTCLCLGIANRLTMRSDLDAHFPLDSCLPCERWINWFRVRNYLGQDFRRFLRHCARYRRQQS
jgi:membrane-bound acyltransferase YfiQ involved in biofilm formation